MKSFCVGFLCCAVIAGAISVIGKEEVKPVAAPPAVAVASPRIAQLEREIAQLKQQLAMVNQQKIAAPGASSALAAAATNESPASNNISPQAYAEHLKSMQRAAEFSQYTNRLQDSNQSMLADLSQKFSAEQVDYTWAPDYQQKISRMFVEVESLNRISPSAIECRTNKCQIKIPVTNNDEANQLTQTVAEAVQGNNNELAKTEVIATQDLSHGVLNLYIAKNNSLKAYE